MITVGIVGNGPTYLIPNLSLHSEKIDIWIGADKGALSVIEQEVKLDYAIGDFDSVNNEELEIIKEHTKKFEQFEIEKDFTDLELALQRAISLNPSSIYFFGVTGGRLDHTLINIQLLEQVLKNKITGVIMDRYNELILYYPGAYNIIHNVHYPTVSFIPITKEVRGLTLTRFYYPLTNATIKMGSTLSISNKLISNNGTFSFDEGIVLVVRSRG
ncbi:thiamine diphosphokinase [Paucisalibacillus sp. EB02]|uniref:thiamine diphosphokinase n=1 Tax=Paucisalibacillus sp. EB02 TaxID=1347087 RepID=UPI0004B2DCF3|nr:thiamine diphosphokinase [Paucisalibacillus sp. EB02]